MKSAREQESVYINEISHSNVINNALCTLDNNALSNNKVHNALYYDDSTVNKDEIKCNSLLTKDALWENSSKSQVPNTINIENLSNIQVQKLSRYVFLDLTKVLIKLVR